MRRVLLRTSISVAALTVFFAVTSARAENEVNWYSGYSCQNPQILYDWGAAYNKSSKSQLFRCEIRRDKGGKGIKDGWVKVINNHPTEDVVCYVTAAQHGTGSFGHSRWTNRFEVSTKDLPPTERRYWFVNLNFGSLSITPDIKELKDSIALFLDCHIPGVRGGEKALNNNEPEDVASGIVAYKVREYP